MSKRDLSTFFISALTKTVPNKKELVYKIADILDIEIESVYRRLAGTVKFSVEEVGKLAQVMNISLDSLLNKDSNKIPIFFQVGLDSNSININTLINRIEDLALHWQTNKSHEINVGFIFNYLPLEFFMFHPHLCKYIYFKWGNTYLATKEFENFSEWEIPERLINAQDKFIDSLKKIDKLRYFWDISLIPNLVQEINYHLLIGMLTLENSSLIKNELHELLDNVEKFLKGRDKEFIHNKGMKFEWYVVNLSVGITAYYSLCENSYRSSINSPFLSSTIHRTSKTALEIRNWINSIRRFSSLISGGCEKERITFFRKQHQIVDSIGVLRPWFE